jgi:hypothetical protein
MDGKSPHDNHVRRAAPKVAPRTHPVDVDMASELPGNGFSVLFKPSGQLLSGNLSVGKIEHQARRLYNS